MTIHLKGFCAPSTDAVPIIPCTNIDMLAEKCGKTAITHLKRQGFRAKAGQFCFVHDNGVLKIALGIVGNDDWRSWADAAMGLPAGCYTLNTQPSETILRGWGSGSYRYKNSKACAQLCIEDAPVPILSLVRAEYMTRFLIDHPANKLSPTRLARRAKSSLSRLAPSRLQHCTEITGTDLLAKNFPLIYTVGKAAEHAPRLVDMAWNSPNNNPKTPQITLIGKGVCFDTGGLDIKPRTAMLAMKKDMGGAAHAIGLAAMILSSSMDVRLRLILGIAENSISSNAMRPSDILTARNGSTIEIGDTDAEGRLILADCLALAGESHNDLIIDFATLTGAARVTLGTDLPALFCNDDDLAAKLTAHPHDPLWRMPLHEAYRAEMNGTISTLNSAPGNGYADAITAALFLEHFVPENTPWAHIDLMAYTPKKISGRASGAAAQGLYGCLEGLKKLFAHKNNIQQSNNR